MKRAPAQLTTKKVLLRIAVLSSVALALVLAVTLSFAEKAESAVRTERLMSLVAAVKAGPLQMARLQAGEIATGQLRALLEASNAADPLFVSARIFSGARGMDTIAEWKRDATPDPQGECIRDRSEEVVFPDSIYPYGLIVRYDECRSIRQFLLFKAGFVWATLAGVGVLVVLIALGLRPVFRSIRSAADELRSPSPGVRARLEFGPLEEILLVAECARRFERDATLAHITQNIVHDLRTPLCAFERILRVNSWGEFVSERSLLESSLHRVHTMIDALRRSDLELLVAPAPSAISLRQVLEETLPFALEKGVSVACDADVFVSCHIDAPKLERAILNLLRNAIESGATRVHLQCNALQGTLQIAVSDDGPGVPEEVLPLLFQRGRSFGKEGGSGLGLAYVRAIARGHGGEVAYGRSAGMSCFTLTLPDAVRRVLDRNEISTCPAGTSRASVNRTAALIHVHLNDETAVARFLRVARERRTPVVTAPCDRYRESSVFYVDASLVTEAMMASGGRIVLAREGDDPGTVISRLTRRVLSKESTLPHPLSHTVALENVLKTEGVIS